MKDNCLDIGIIQAFMDGELVHDEWTRVSGHFAVCSKCTSMLAEAEDESAMVFPALEREFNTLVPTHRLWNKINDAIEVERESRPFWQKAWAFIVVSLANPSITVAASLLVVAAIFAGVWINRTTTPLDDTVALNNAPGVSVSTPALPDVRRESNTSDVVTGPSVAMASMVTHAAYRPDDRRRGRIADMSVSAAANSNGYMPGEESYVKTIASLNKTVDEQKDGIMRPGERIAYERDMAVVNDSIAKMRNEVKRNPKNESAKQVLYSSYQNKIDLLNSVAQKEELVASLR